MGRPKALLTAPGSGVTMLERTVTILGARLGSAALLGRPSFELPIGKPLAGCEIVPDRFGVGGPLGALLGAFDARPRTAWLMVACDLPWLEVAAIDWLLDERRDDRVAVLPRLGAARGPTVEIEPLLAVYEPAARPLLERLALEPNGAQRSLQRLHRLPGVASPRPPAAIRACWTNVNSPAEWAALTRLTPPPTPSSPRRRARRAPARHPR